MVEKLLGGKRFVFYDSIEDLPISQFHRYSKYVLVGSGIGDSLANIDSHITRVINFMKVDIKKAHQELLNLRQNIYMVLTEQDVQTKATLCLLKSIDGVEWTDFSDSGLQTLYDMVSGERFADVNDLAKKVREAIDENLSRYFPKIFDDATSKNYCDFLRKRALLQGDAILNNKNHEDEIDALDRQIYGMLNVKSFEGADSEEIRFDKQFEEMCLTMAKEFGGGIKKFTTMEFYSAYEKLDKQYEEQKKQSKKRK